MPRNRWTSQLTANLGTKLISVVIAGVLWSVVLGSRTVEVTKEIPLEVITSAEVVPSNDLPEKVSFRLVGPKAFLRAILDRREEPIRINLSESSPGLVTHRFFSDNIRVPIGVKVMAVSPAALLIRLEPVRRKDVAVRAELRGAPPVGYRLVGFQVVPSTLRIRGPESKVDAVNEIPAMPVDVSSLKESTDRELTLDLSRMGVQPDQPVPHLRVDIIEEPEHLRHRSGPSRARMSPRDH